MESVTPVKRYAKWYAFAERPLGEEMVIDSNRPKPECTGMGYEDDDVPQYTDPITNSIIGNAAAIHKPARHACRCGSGCVCCNDVPKKRGLDTIVIKDSSSS